MVFPYCLPHPEPEKTDFKNRKLVILGCGNADFRVSNYGFGDPKVSIAYGEVDF